MITELQSRAAVNEMLWAKSEGVELRAWATSAYQGCFLSVLVLLYKDVDNQTEVTKRGGNYCQKVQRFLLLGGRYWQPPVAQDQRDKV